ncbi:MAG: putative sulfate exporter family transporter [Spirosomataceae bacterium]
MILKIVLYFLGLVLCCFSFVSSSLALLLGFVLNILVENPLNKWAGSLSNYLLKVSVMGLGFGIDIQVLLNTGRDNIFITTAFVVGTLVVGLWIGKLLQMERITTILISVGTAICGGSAIAAVGSILKANASQLSVATGTVFLLNAFALFIFPVLGHYFDLSQEQFGAWAAIAIHDTSSVVGAASKYGENALHIASVTKMLRILWIIPVSLLLVFGFRENRESFKIPMFIIGFLVASLLHSFFNEFATVYQILYKIAKQGLVLSLFVIGSTISTESIQKIGSKTLLQAVLLWVLVCIISLLYTNYFL